MSYTEGIVFAFTAFGEATKPAVFAVGMKLLPAAGEYLMSVSLVAHIPYQLIIWCVQHIVQGDGQLYHAQAGAKMPAMNTYAIDNELPQLGADLL